MGGELEAVECPGTGSQAGKRVEAAAVMVAGLDMKGVVEMAIKACAVHPFGSSVGGDRGPRRHCRRELPPPSVAPLAEEEVGVFSLGCCLCEDLHRLPSRPRSVSRECGH